MGSFKHLPNGRGTQITAYFCTQLASKSSSLISYIVHISYQPISVYLRMVKMYKTQRENILQRPIRISYTRKKTQSMKQHHVHLLRRSKLVLAYFGTSTRNAPCSHSGVGIFHLERDHLPVLMSYSSTSIRFLSRLQPGKR